MRVGGGADSIGAPGPVAPIELPPEVVGLLVAQAGLPKTVALADDKEASVADGCGGGGGRRVRVRKGSERGGVRVFLVGLFEGCHLARYESWLLTTENGRQINTFKTKKRSTTKIVNYIMLTPIFVF